MDFHILIVISCVFLFSLLSLLLINRFFRRKTFEEVVAEKRALTEKIYGQQRATAKKARKLPSKKIVKREKKQRTKAAPPKPSVGMQYDDSDDEPQTASDMDKENVVPGTLGVHVEFEPEPEVVTYTTETLVLPSAAAQKTNTKKNKNKSEKKTAGILVNKNEPVIVKETPVVEENNFEIKHPKDVVELKKLEKDFKQSTTKKNKEVNKKEKLPASPTTAVTTNSTTTTATAPINNSNNVDVKQSEVHEEKIRQTSPKVQLHNKVKASKKTKDTTASKDLLQAVEKLSDNESIGVSLLMQLFRRAELNRSEIQILIDYLLNRQQDMPTTHSEWSDDQCQKLKRQLEEKERALAEEQEASIGIQAKLRDLRAEINAERLQMNATIKANAERMHAKEQEILGLTQELQSLNEKLNVERQQFQAKLLREKQAGTQDLLAQLQRLQNELAHKDKCINELTCLVNASRQNIEEVQQKNDIIQSQAQQIHALEQQRDELEQVSNNQIFELEKAKTMETENAEYKVEVRNLQNALESAKVDLAQLRKECESLKTELAHVKNFELNEKFKEIQNLQNKNAELMQQLEGINNKNLEQNKEHTGMQAMLNQLQTQLAEKERLLNEFNGKQTELLQRLQQMATSSQQQAVKQQELEKLVETLRSDLSLKQQQLQELEQRSQQLISREKELLQQLQEHKEKNNQQEQQLLSAIQKPASTTTATATVDTAAKEQAKIRALYERLYPEAVKSCANLALSAPFDKWIEEVLSAHVKQQATPSPETATATTNTIALSSSHKSTQSNNNNSGGGSSNNNNGTSNGDLYNDKNLSNNSSNNKNNNNSSRTSSSDSNSQINNSKKNNNNSSSSTEEAINDAEEVQSSLQLENAQLRTKIDELTKLVTKTSNTLSELESRAREQEDHWRTLVRSQEEKILILQHSNGEQDV